MPTNHLLTGENISQFVRHWLGGQALDLLTYCYFIPDKAGPLLCREPDTTLCRVGAHPKLSGVKLWYTNWLRICWRKPLLNYSKDWCCKHGGKMNLISKVILCNKNTFTVAINFCRNKFMLMKWFLQPFLLTDIIGLFWS